MRPSLMIVNIDTTVNIADLCVGSACEMLRDPAYCSAIGKPALLQLSFAPCQDAFFPTARSAPSNSVTEPTLQGRRQITLFLAFEEGAFPLSCIERSSRCARSRSK